MGIRGWVGLGIGIGLSAGCAATQPAAVTRVVSTDPASFAGRPVCFAPPTPTSDLMAQSHARDALRLCEAGARQESVSIVPIGTPGCAVATVSWAAKSTGDFVAECNDAFFGRECAGHDVKKKLAKVTIAEPNGAPVVETVAALRSNKPEFTEQSFAALCRVAFHQYPRPLKNYQFDAEIPDVE